MAMYTYSIAGDFPASWVSLTNLIYEILAEETITTTLSHINNEVDDVEIVFNSSLTAPEITALDSVVASHSNSWIQTQGFSGIPHAALLDVGTTTHSGIDTHIVTVDAHHNRLHAVTSTVDHTAENWKVLYTDGSGNVQELSLGADGESFVSNGPASAPYFTTISGTGGVGFGDDLCAIQICRSTNFSVTGAAWQDVSFDITDIENDATILEHDDVNTDRIKIKEDGIYLVNYETSLDLNGESGDDDFWLRVIKNDTTEVPGSEIHLNDAGDTHTHSGTFVAEFSSGDFITLQVKNNVTTAILEAGATFKVVCLRGTKGADGPPGSGSTVHVYDDGTPIDGTPFSTLNFQNATISGSPTISGGVDISVSVDESVFGSEFHEASSEGNSSTTSSSYQQKLRLTTSSLPSGTYIIYYSYEVDGNGDKAHSRVEINDSEEINYNVYDSSLDGYIAVSGFIVKSSFSGVKNIDIDYRTNSSGNTIDIRRARITLWRIS